MERVISCSILTPEKLIYDGDVGFAVVQAYDGEIGFLYAHSPLISTLGVGEVRLNSLNSVDYFVIEGGIVQILDNKLIILAEKAYTRDELDPAELEGKIKELDSSLSEMKHYSMEKVLIKAEQDKFKVRLKVSKR